MSSDCNGWASIVLQAPKLLEKLASLNFEILVSAEDESSDNNIASRPPLQLDWESRGIEAGRGGMCRPPLCGPAATSQGQVKAEATDARKPGVDD